MKTIINDNFMLHSETAKRLYHDYAEKMPIVDYHCHLNPADIANDIKFSTVTELMLGGDHYKWRMMRSAGIEEKYMTGDAPAREKFRAFAGALELAIGNPIYHWTHLELKRYFNIDEALTAESADRIYDRCNELLAQDDFSARNLIARSNVKVICTTDDPMDTLEHHKAIATSGFGTRVYPTFRPDNAIHIDKPSFDAYVKNRMKVSTYAEFIKLLKDRINFFAENGCRVSDHALEAVFFARGDAEAVFNKRLSGEKITEAEAEIFKTEVLLAVAEEYAKRGWAMQLHIGALRNNNERMFQKLGPDTGFDSINDLSIAQNLSKLLNALDVKGVLPKTILYSLNPKDNYTLGTMLGNFQSPEAVGKIQLGSGWWFNDQRDGMEAQLQALANLGVLGGFVGMLTDSRSLVSYPRHEYFRRIFCNLIATWVENGEYPDDPKALEKIVCGVAYDNAVRYFGF